MNVSKTVVGLALTTSLMSFQAHSEISQCVDLARIIVGPSYTNITENELTGLNYYALCQSEDMAQESTLEVAYKAFSLTAGFSDQEKQELCSKSLNQLGISQREYRSGSNHFADALPTIEECVNAVNAGWDINYQKIQKNAVGLGISHDSETGGKIHGIDIIPSKEAMSCTGMPSSFPVTVTRSSPIAMTCVRKPRETSMSGVVLESSEAATINLRLASGPVPITLPGYSGSAFDDVEADITVLQEKIQGLNNSLGNYSSAKNDWVGNETTRYSKRNKVVCPEGQYLVGLKGVDIDSGGYCTSCISDIEFYCRPLPGIPQ
jgi:hypothetical protein